MVGSFISVLSYRLHHGQKGILKGRSKCTNCETELAARDLIPLLSYLALRGKCRHCDKEISYMYPLIEIICGFLFVLLFYKFPFLDEFLNFDLNYFLLYLLWGFYTFILAFTFFHDLHYLRVADSLLVPAILIGLVASISPYTTHIMDSLLGMLIAIGFFGGQVYLSKGRWLGGGDIRIGAFMGVILGWKMVILAIVLAYVIGSIASIFVIIKKKKFYGLKVPFAPFLVAGTLCAFYFGEAILRWYLGLMGV